MKFGDFQEFLGPSPLKYPIFYFKLPCLRAYLEYPHYLLALKNFF